MNSVSLLKKHFSTAACSEPASPLGRSIHTALLLSLFFTPALASAACSNPLDTLCLNEPYDWCASHPYDVICGFPGNQDPPTAIYGIQNVAGNPYSTHCNSSITTLSAAAQYEIANWWYNVYPLSHWRGQSYEMLLWVQNSADTQYTGNWWAMTQGTTYTTQELQNTGWVRLAGPNSINDSLWTRADLWKPVPVGCQQL